MTLYLTDDTPPEEIARAKLSGRVHGVKLYPAGATTNSDAGVTRLSRCSHALEKMEELGLPLLMHGEVDRPGGRRVRPREGLHRGGARPAGRALPGPQGGARAHHHARGGAVRRGAPAPNVAATITAHHLLHEPQRALPGRHPAAPLLPAGAQARGASRGAGRGRDLAATRSSSSAPTARRTRAAPRRPTAAAPASTPRTPRIELYADRVRGSRRARQAGGLRQPVRRRIFYGLPRNQDTITLVREEWTVPERAALRRRGAGAAARGREASLEARPSASRSSMRCGPGSRGWARRARSSASNALADEADLRTASGRPVRFVPPATADAVLRDPSVRDRARADAAREPARPVQRARLARLSENQGAHQRAARRRHSARARAAAGAGAISSRCFDEGGVIVQSRRCRAARAAARLSLEGALLGTARRSVRRRMRLQVLGHATLEQALEPWPGIACKAILVPAAETAGCRRARMAGRAPTRRGPSRPPAAADLRLSRLDARQRAPRFLRRASLLQGKTGIGPHLSGRHRLRMPRR